MQQPPATGVSPLKVFGKMLRFYRNRGRRPHQVLLADSPRRKAAARRLRSAILSTQVAITADKLDEDVAARLARQTLATGGRGPGVPGMPVPPGTGDQLSRICLGFAV
jgi:hypothetical protein